MMATAQAYVGAKSGADCVAISRSVAMEGARLRVLSQAVQVLSFNKGVADASAIPPESSRCPHPLVVG